MTTADMHAWAFVLVILAGILTIAFMIGDEAE